MDQATIDRAIAVALEVAENDGLSPEDRLTAVAQVLEAHAHEQSVRDLRRKWRRWSWRVR